MNVAKLAFGLAALAVCLMLPPLGPAAAQCSCGYVEPCTITTNLADFTSGSERTVCSARTTAGFGSVAYTLVTPGGRQYRIENPATFLFDSWFINGTPGVRVATDDPARSCYRTVKVQICLGQ